MSKKLRRVLAVAMMAMLMVGMAVSAGAEVKPLALDMKVRGNPLNPKGWIQENKEYQDESIHAIVTTDGRLTKSSKGKATIHYAVIEIADPTQLRTVLSFDSYENKEQAKPAAMAKGLNCVIAINDDFVKMSSFKGYVMRQGVFYCDTVDEFKEGKAQDVLIIDDRGDFHTVLKASSAAMKEFLAELEAEGRKPINIFTFGPTLVIDGEAQEIKYEDSIHSTHIAAARVALCQLDTLKYACFAVDGGDGVGMTGQEFANYIAEKMPECKIAYNMDGGGSSQFFIGPRNVSRASGRRKISGLIYFASAATEE